MTYLSKPTFEALTFVNSSLICCLACISLCRLDCKFSNSILSNRCERLFLHRARDCKHKEEKIILFSIITGYTMYTIGFYTLKSTVAKFRKCMKQINLVKNFNV